MAEFKMSRFELETKGLTITAGGKHVVKVVSGSGKRILVEDAHFHTDSSLFLPRDPAADGQGVNEPRAFSNEPFWSAMEANQSEYVRSARKGEFVPPEPTPSGKGTGGGGVGGLEAIVAALKFFASQTDHAVVVAGHTDRAGSETHNEELSDARARSVAAVLEGEREAYVRAAKGHDKPESDASMLAFASRSRGFPCDPADPARPTPSEIKTFQKAYNTGFGKKIAEDGVVGDETRGAYFDLLEFELASQAGGTEALASLRAKLKFVDPDHKTLACGERFPIEQPDKDGVASQTNRRVEILLFPPSPLPDLSAADAPDQIYGKGAFEFERVAPQSLAAATTNDAASETELSLEDASAPEPGVGEMDGELVSEMAILQESFDPSDQYAFLDPFDAGFPPFGTQAQADFSTQPGNAVLV